MARGTQHRKRRPRRMLRVAPSAGEGEAEAEAARAGRTSSSSARLRRHAKWVFVFLALVFALSFVLFGVGSGSTGIGDVLQNFFSGTQRAAARRSRLARRRRRTRTRRTRRPGATSRRSSSRTDDDDGAITALTRYTALQAQGRGRAAGARRPLPAAGAGRISTLYLDGAGDAARSSRRRRRSSPTSGSPLGRRSLAAEPDLGRRSRSQTSTDTNDAYSKFVELPQTKRGRRLQEARRAEPARTPTTQFRARAGRAGRRTTRQTRSPPTRSSSSSPRTTRSHRPRKKALKQLKASAAASDDRRDTRRLRASSDRRFRPHRRRPAARLSLGRRPSPMNFDIKTEQLSDRRLRHLARGRGRPLHGARAQAAAARGDRPGREPRDRRLHRHDVHRLDHARRARRRRQAPAHERRASSSLVCNDRNITKIFEITGLDRVFAIFATRDEAVARLDGELKASALSTRAPHRCVCHRHAARRRGVPRRRLRRRRAHDRERRRPGAPARALFEQPSAAPATRSPTRGRRASIGPNLDDAFGLVKQPRASTSRRSATSSAARSPIRRPTRDRHEPAPNPGMPPNLVHGPGRAGRRRLRRRVLGSSRAAGRRRRLDGRLTRSAARHCASAGRLDAVAPASTRSARRCAAVGAEVDDDVRHRDSANRSRVAVDDAALEPVRAALGMRRDRRARRGRSAERVLDRLQRVAVADLAARLDAGRAHRRERVLEPLLRRRRARRPRRRPSAGAACSAPARRRSTCVRAPSARRRELREQLARRRRSRSRSRGSGARRPRACGGACRTGGSSRGRA